ncbi:MAG TPA: class I SAM-dependent methyltransferase [Jatrophihabitans sp.]|nr:class I SAM-dependent methyltransferase [Jatrophihabitans sp.]
MRQIRGKQVIELAAPEFAELAGRYGRVVLDLGTGDGKHALQLSRQRPDELIIGLDAAKDNLRRVSGRAGAANLVYLWAAAERLPPELTGIGELHVLMPWGSLLRGMLDDGSPMLRELAGRCTPDARFLITLNLHAWRPPVPEVGEHAEPTPESALAELAPRYARHGWRLDGARYLDDAAITELATSWTRRLNSSRDRLAVLALTGVINPSADRSDH